MARFLIIRALLIGIILPTVVMFFIQPWEEIDVPSRLVEIIYGVMLLEAIRFAYRSRKNILDKIKRSWVKRKINRCFKKRLSSAMLRKLQMEPRLIKLDGDTTEVSVVSCHVRDLDRVIEHGKSDPRKLMDMINRTIEISGKAVANNDGLMGRYSSGQMIAFWNVPIKIDDPSSKAVASAIEIVDLIGKTKTSAPKSMAISVGIGIAAGTMLIGNIGSSDNAEYGGLGTAASIAGLLSEKSKEYHVSILASREIISKIDDRFVKVELDTARIGGPEGLPIYAVIGYGKNIGNPLQISTCYSQHAKFLSAYREQRWDMAMVIGSSLRTAWNGNLKEYYEMMLSRCRNLKKNPPGRDWDGIYLPPRKASALETLDG